MVGRGDGTTALPGCEALVPVVGAGVVGSAGRVTVPPRLKSRNWGGPTEVPVVAGAGTVLAAGFVDLGGGDAVPAGGVAVVLVDCAAAAVAKAEPMISPANAELR